MEAFHYNSMMVLVLRDVPKLRPLLDVLTTLFDALKTLVGVLRSLP